MTNQNITQFKFKGRVFLSPAFQSVKLAEENLAEKPFTELEKDFKDYWRNGAHPRFGKDAAFARPNEILALNVRHLHSDNGQYLESKDPKDYTGTEKCWEEWRKGNSYTRPASNAFVLYTVTENRDAMLIGYLDRDAHEKTERQEVMEDIIAVTYSFYAHMKCKAMPLEEHEFIFSDKWLNLPGASGAVA